MHMPSKFRVFEEHRIPTTGSDLLYAKMMFPKPPVFPKRIVFIPPLIGAGASHALIAYRHLTRRGSVLLSFEYSGHPHSTGIFELDKTIIDTRNASIWAEKYANEHGMPLHALSICYAIVTLAAQFRDREWRCPFLSINSVSGLFSLDRIIQFANFSPIFSRRLGVALDRELFVQGIQNNAYDWNGAGFRDSLHEFLTGLFPDINIGIDYFEELAYDKVNIPRTLLQLLHAQYLKGVEVPPEIPCNFFFGRNDDIMFLTTLEGRETYRRDALSLIPHASLYEGEFDHYGHGPDHDRVIDKIADLFEETESRAAPLTMKLTMKEQMAAHQDVQL